MIFSDRCIARHVAVALQAERGDVVYLDDRFAPDTPDIEWLRVVAEEGWLAFTRDIALRRRRDQRAAVLALPVRLFVLAQAAPMTSQMAHHQIARTLAQVDRGLALPPPPFIGLIRKDGRLEFVVPERGLDAEDQGAPLPRLRHRE